MLGKNIKIAITSIIAVFVSSAAVADQCYSWGCETTLKNVSAVSGGYVLIEVNADTAPAICGADLTSSTKQFKINPTHIGIDRMYAALLSAKSAEKRISFTVYQSTTGTACFLQVVTAIDQ